MRDLVGHGIGRNLHEDPSVPNFGKAGHGVKLAAGMTIAIEPMVNAGDYHVAVLDDETSPNLAPCFTYLIPSKKL